MTLKMSQLNEYFKSCCEFDTHTQTVYGDLVFHCIHSTQTTGKKVGETTTYEQYQYIYIVNETKPNKTERNALGRLSVPQAMCIECGKQKHMIFLSSLLLEFIANYMSVKMQNMFRKL